MKFLAVALVCLVLAGCSESGDPHMPLAKGYRWTYASTIGMNAGVTEVEVAGPANVAGRDGWRLASNWSPSEVAWIGNRLVASRLGGQIYSPPVPILVVEDGESSLAWEGERGAFGSRSKWTGTLLVKKETSTLVGRKLDVRTSTLRLQRDGVEDEILMIFAPGLGLIRQEERRNGRLVGKLAYLSGP